MEQRRKVLFLCTGNSVRSQMAEALVNSRFPEWQAVSAGVHPAGFVHPSAVRVLEEIGVVHVGESKSIERFRDEVFDRVVTVCDDANEECPVWLGAGLRRHVSFPDPANARGTEEQRLQAFRAVLGEIAAVLPGLLS